MGAKLEPLGDRIVVKLPDAGEKTTSSGLIVPDLGKDKPQEGEVIAIGPGRLLENGTLVPLSLVVGDIILYSKYGGTEVTVDDEEFLVLSERDILAKVVRQPAPVR